MAERSTVAFSPLRPAGSADAAPEGVTFNRSTLIKRKLQDDLGYTEEIVALEKLGEAIGAPGNELVKKRRKALKADFDAIWQAYESVVEDLTQAGSTINEAEDAALDIARAMKRTRMIYLDKLYPENVTKIQVGQAIKKDKARRYTGQGGV